uniref:Uncharacterized protein n=1 Tax=Haptolina brevifila TaxID=156173 RepID=A0A7S2I453_9EUKA
MYLNWLRQAAIIASIALRSSPPRKKQKESGGRSALVRNVSDSEDEPDRDTPFDTVTEEADRWSKLDKALVKKFRDAAGIVNEFALLYEQCNNFPLHYTVFMQTASHLPHEGNTEQLFLRSGALSRAMDPARLSVWTSIGVNYGTFAP